MLKNLLGHTWCDCLECDQSVEALRILVVGRGNRDDGLMLALIHHTHDIDTTYHIFSGLYLICHPAGDIVDPQYVKDDEDDEDWDEDEDDDDY
jgi:hypothetical protein